MSNELERRRPATMRENVQRDAQTMLVDMVGESKAKEAAARTGMAFAAAHRAARNPQDIENCSRASIASCVALSALTGLMPGGANPLVWLIPKGGELTWVPSHRGLMTLCQRAGYQLIPVVVGPSDDLVAEFGEVKSHRQDYQNPATGLNDLQGVIVSCKRIADGAVFGRFFVTQSDIIARSRVRGAGPVWKSWPLEMAMKTAIKYVCARGLIPVESIELDQTLSADLRNERTEVVSASAKAPVAPSAAFLLQAPEPDPGSEPEPTDSPADTDPTADAPDDGDAPPWGGE
tara:strand:+ start:32 stop:901 length:870 start_codon:yes stop_codon:yes gene_type:complete